MTSSAIPTVSGCWVAASAVPPSVVYARISNANTYNVTQFLVGWTNVTNSCINYYSCNINFAVDSDIIGLGVTAAFVTTAWASFLLLVLTYWLGLLSPHLLRKADTEVFFANSRNSRNNWRDRIEKVALSISDQQLITGLAILAAGFYDQFVNDLSVQYWSIVTSLAWLSSTVHLVTLSLLRERLKENRVMLITRLAGMILLLVILLIAETPSVGSGFAFGDPRMPTRCVWKAKMYASSYWNVSETGQLERDHFPNAFNPASMVSYGILITSYVWKLLQFFDMSRSWIHRWGREKPDQALRRAMAWTLLSPRNSHSGRAVAYWIAYRSINYLYLYFSIWMELLESFFATILLLLFALSWASVRLFLNWYRVHVEANFYLGSAMSGASTWSFGQLLPLLLLGQPLLALAEHFAEKQTTHAQTAVTTTSTNNSIDLSLPGQPITALVPNVASAVKNQSPDLVNQLYTFGAFKALLWLHVFGALATAGAVFDSTYEFVGDAGSYVLLWWSWYIVGLFGWIGFMLFCVLSFSKQLR